MSVKDSSAGMAEVGLDLSAVRDISVAITAAHRFVYLVPEAAQEAVALGLAATGPGGPSYFALRSAALGTVPWQVTAATFYNFPPRQVRRVDEAWALASPEQWQAARFRIVEQALRRLGVHLGGDEIAAARSLVDPVVDAADYAGKPMAAANAAVTLPSDPLLALWQQITVLREWRGDAHVVVLAANDLGPCDCNVMQTATGRLPTALARATRHWDDQEWAAATNRLVVRGWLDADGTETALGAAAREDIEVETDRHCAALWASIGAAGTRRLAELIAPISEVSKSLFP